MEHLYRPESKYFYVYRFLSGATFAWLLENLLLVVVQYWL